MNNLFAAKYLQHLNKRKADKGEKGFTLIELLVVVIIIGVLAAVALPNLLGQVGKARETEAKNAMGSINRTQQAFHFEKQRFAPSLTDANLGANNVLGVVVDSDYFSFTTTTASASNATQTVAEADAVASARDGVRPYSAGIGFNTASGQYNSVVCQTDAIQDNAIAATAGVTPSCPASTTELN